MQETLEVLDQIEGYQALGKSNEYTRILVEIIFDDGSLGSAYTINLQAWIELVSSGGLNLRFLSAVVCRLPGRPKSRVPEVLRKSSALLYKREAWVIIYSLGGFSGVRVSLGCVEHPL